jgi:hypothetical protein
MLSRNNFNHCVEQKTNLKTMGNELVARTNFQLSHDNEHAFVLRGMMHQEGIGGPRNEKLAVACYDHAILYCEPGRLKAEARRPR